MRLLQGELAERDPSGGTEVRRIPTLHHPTDSLELLVDFHARPLFRGAVVMAVPYTTRPHKT